MNLPKPDNITDAEWKELKRAISIITEHFSNMALFINWVSEDGETQHTHILQGNKFAIQNHIDKWHEGVFDVDEDEEEGENSFS
jgi:hypothetical protein